MAEEIPHPTEYARPPVYQRPLGGIARVMDRVLKQGMTQADAIKPES